MLVPAEDDPGRHRGDHSGDVKRLAGQIGGPAEQGGGGDDQGLVGHPPHHRDPGGGDGDPDRGSAQSEQEEAADRRAGVESAAQGRRDGEAEQDEAGGVVEKAFALQQGPKPPRQRDPLEHGAGGDGVGRRDDRAEREAGRPGQLRDQPVTVTATTRVVNSTAPTASDRIPGR